MSELLDELHAAHAEKEAADAAFSAAVQAWREATFAEQSADNEMRAEMDRAFAARAAANNRLADARAALKGAGAD